MYTLSQSTKPTFSRPISDLIQQARRGVLRRRVDEVAQVIRLTDKEMARILNMSIRGLHGKGASDHLSLSASERLLLLERLIQHGLTVFDGRADLLARWLRTPLPELAYHEETDAAPEPTEAFSLRDLGSFEEPMTRYADSTQSVNATDVPATAVPQSPLAMLDTVSGFALAEDVLGRIEWGIAG